MTEEQFEEYWAAVLRHLETDEEHPADGEFTLEQEVELLLRVEELCTPSAEQETFLSDSGVGSAAAVSEADRVEATLMLACSVVDKQLERERRAGRCAPLSSDELKLLGAQRAKDLVASGFAGGPDVQSDLAQARAEVADIFLSGAGSASDSRVGVARWLRQQAFVRVRFLPAVRSVRRPLPVRTGARGARARRTVRRSRAPAGGPDDPGPAAASVAAAGYLGAGRVGEVGRLVGLARGDAGRVRHGLGRGCGVCVGVTAAAARVDAASVGCAWLGRAAS